ncbi:MAG: DUF1571 domain-containing protein [Planctomycetaceae bacterium]|nr:DUF1571 domain-containing protein [Planctomycetaceae bacterium]
MPCNRSAQSSGKSNFLAICASALSIGVIGVNFDPVPAGEDVQVARVTPSSTVIENLADVPLPPGVTPTPPDSRNQTPGIEAPQSGSGNLSHHDAIKFSLLLLKDGARFIENIDSYQVTFDKRERINGDIGELETMDLKVRHSPTFGIYMKWKNGDTGRQLLYNDEYEDKQMVVKLGGLKGRILPALKLDPLGAEAKAGARYPVTEAGLVGMIRQMILHREKDLSHGQGIACIRLANEVFDDRECYCFRYEYSAPEFNPLYRKSIVLMDTRYHVPLKVTSYTWSNNADGMTPEQLDEMTLIEDYAFRKLDMSTKLASEVFSRDNPAYRM